MKRKLNSRELFKKKKKNRMPHTCENLARTTQRSLAGYSPQGRKESDTDEETEYSHMQDIYPPNIWRFLIFFVCPKTPNIYKMCGFLTPDPCSPFASHIQLSAYANKVKMLISHVLLFMTPVDYSQPGSSIHGILQARILEWVGVPFSR